MITIVGLIEKNPNANPFDSPLATCYWPVSRMQLDVWFALRKKLNFSHDQQ